MDWTRAGVWRVLVVLVAVAALAIILGWLPLQLHLHLRQDALQADVDLRIKLFFIKVKRQVSITDRVQMALEHIIKRWRATGEPVKVPLQKTIRRMPRSKIMRTVRRPLRYLGRRTRCTRLAIAAEIGGADAMESAMLAGASWAVVGTALGIFSGMVRLDPGIPRVTIVPNYGGPAFRLDTDCILRLRLGHAIVAGVWLLRRALREKELVAWARDSWRRKGVEGSGRASDSGPDEDGHGEP
jgi:hypothetical protein